MAIRLPAAAVAISTLELTVFDATASCGGPDASGGLELFTTGLELGVPKQLSISAGVRTLSVVAFDGGTPVARGCTRLELIAGQTHQVALDLVESPAGPDGGVPDAGPSADAGPTDASIADAVPTDADPNEPDAGAADAADAADAGPTADAQDDRSCAPANVVLLSVGTLNNESIDTGDPGDQTGTCGGADSERVYQFTFFGTKQVDIDTAGNFPHRLYLRSADCLSGTEQACVASSANAANIHFDSLAGGTYYIFVDADSSSTPRQFDITLSLTGAVTPPPNDTCPAAQALVAGLTSAGTLDAAADDTATCGGGSEADVFYKLTLASDSSVLVNLTSGADTSLSVRASDCSTVVTCLNDTVAGEQADIPVLTAGTYFVVVEGVSGGAGAFTVGYTTGAPRPANDECSGAITLSDGVSLTGERLTNARDNADGTCGDTTSGDVVYEVFVPPGLNRRVRATVSNASAFDPVVYLRAAACNGTEVACAQTGTGAGELLDIPSVAPGTYYLWVDAMGGGSGTFDVLFELLPEVPPPTNDTCSAPDTLAEDTSESHSTFGASDDYDLSCLSFDSVDAVHELTIAADSAVLVSVTPTLPDWNLAVSLRANCAAGPDISCVADQFSSRHINQPNLAAGTYSVVVDGDAGALGDYDIVYDVRPADTSFGYWVRNTTGTYTSIAGTPGATNRGVPQSVSDAAPGDEFVEAIALPFAFSYYGNSFNSVSASSNMYLTFDAAPTGTASFEPDCPIDSSSPSNAIYLFWDDGISMVSAGSEMWTRVDGVTPNRTFTIEYKNFQVLNCQGPCSVIDILANQQAVLFENGDIELRYGPRKVPTASAGCSPRHEGCAATIGLEGEPTGGPDIDEAQCQASGVVDGRVIQYINPR